MQIKQPFAIALLLLPLISSVLSSFHFQNSPSTSTAMAKKRGLGGKLTTGHNKKRGGGSSKSSSKSAAKKPKSTNPKPSATAATTQHDERASDELSDAKSRIEAATKELDDEGKGRRGTRRGKGFFYVVVIKPSTKQYAFFRKCSSHVRQMLKACKLGFTRQDPRKRLSNINVGNLFELEIMAFPCDEPELVESFWHGEYDHHVVTGEWYLLDVEEDVARIKREMEGLASGGLFMTRDASEFDDATMEEYISPDDVRERRWNALKSKMINDLSGNEVNVTELRHNHGDAVATHSFTELTANTDTANIGVFQSSAEKDDGEQDGKLPTISVGKASIKRARGASGINAGVVCLLEVKAPGSPIAIDGEWRVTYERGKQRKLALLSLAVVDEEGNEYVLECEGLHEHDGLPENLKDMLLDENNLLLGHYVHVDLCKIGRDFGLKDEMNKRKNINVIDLRQLAKELDLTTNGHIKLSKLTQIILQEQLPKDCQVSNWEDVLTLDQIKYAALDVLVCLRLLKRMDVIDSLPNDHRDEEVERLLGEHFATFGYSRQIKLPKNGKYFYLFKPLLRPGTEVTPHDLWVLSIVKMGCTKNAQSRWAHLVVSCFYPVEMIWFNVGAAYEQIEAYFKDDCCLQCIGGEHHALIWPHVVRIYSILSNYIEKGDDSWLNIPTTLLHRRERSRAWDAFERKIMSRDDLISFAEANLDLVELKMKQGDWEGCNKAQVSYSRLENLICQKTLAERGTDWSHMYNKERLCLSRNRKADIRFHVFNDGKGWLDKSGLDNGSFDKETYRELLGFDRSLEKLPAYWHLTAPSEFTMRLACRRTRASGPPSEGYMNSFSWT